ncbi:MAG TPA: amylo-alpha-1,6-glucosidase [Bryobacteraceae bacterium]|nr:amylo-alpha-1,6-glucosidase [Bryobacteraceae bacterium]
MKPDLIRFDQSVCSRLDLTLSREWLETNGLGGFASSTLIGLNTRRYHGLLTASTTPPTGRVLLLSKLEETVVIDGQRYELASNQYPGAIHPQGYQYLKEFRLDPFPVFIYDVAGLEIEKRVFMVHGENTTVTEYEVRSIDGSAKPKCELELRPLIAFRDYHSTTHKNDALNPALDTQDGLVSITAYSGLPPLYFAHNAQELITDGRWYMNFEYRIERERGLDFEEDLYQPFTLRFQLSRRNAAAVIASTQPHDAKSAAVLRDRERRRREAVAAAPPIDQPLVRTLTAAADQYLVQRGSFKSIVAGYHWFTDWGRDTMIALPGLTLVTGRFDIARQILEAYAGCVDQGLLPNRFPDAGETPEYNTADATLWFFEAIRAYLHYSGDEKFVRQQLYPILKDIIDWHVRGTRYGIHVDADGLLACGEPGVQLTWMDAKVGDYVVTPRIGKPVEIQALWYNALCIMEGFGRRFGDPSSEALSASLALEASATFNKRFWNESTGCLYDVVENGHADGSLRPNQIFAVSLPHSMLPPEKARSVVETVQTELLTPLGLRTLSRHDPRYRAHYEGGVTERDTAYHLGTVWPWLMGPFITAYMKVKQRSEAARQQCETWLAAFSEHVTTAGLGHICEIADAEYPYTPRGCIAQAWSAAEILRAAVEDVYAAATTSKRRPTKAVANPPLAKAAKP